MSNLAIDAQLAEQMDERVCPGPWRTLWEAVSELVSDKPLRDRLEAIEPMLGGISLDDSVSQDVCHEIATLTDELRAINDRTDDELVRIAHRVVVLYDEVARRQFD